MNYTPDKIRQVTGYFLLSCIAGYIILSLYLLAFPRTVFVSKKATQYYRWFALPGPFFSDNRLAKLNHFMFSYKTHEGVWTALRNPEQENFIKYNSNPVRYAALRKSKYERFMARALDTRITKRPDADPTSLKEFKKLHAYLKRNYIPPTADSIQLLYTSQDLSATSLLTDTLFQITYKSF